MADRSNEGSSTSGETASSIIELNIKTLDSHIYNFQVNKDVRHLNFLNQNYALYLGNSLFLKRGKMIKENKNK